MPQSWRQQVSTEERPAETAFAITPSDVTDFAYLVRGIYVGGGGNITAVINGTPVLFTAVPQGVILPVNASRVNASGTTATALVGLA